MNEELKPCPFCGHKARKWRYFKCRGNLSNVSHKSYVVDCHMCGASTQFGTGIVDGAHWEWEKTKKSWNTRADTGLVEALGMDGPWNILTCAKALILAAMHLLDDHNCDAHGYENVSQAIRMMTKHIESLEKALAKHKGEQDA